jgi:hypothetical protein
MSEVFGVGHDLRVSEAGLSVARQGQREWASRVIEFAQVVKRKKPSDAPKFAERQMA